MLVTMKSETSQPQKNLTFSLLLGRQWPSALPTYRRHEQEKKRQFDQRIREVEHSTFTPLVLSTTNLLQDSAMLSEKRDVPYCKMIGWMRCRMSFSLVSASVMSIRGADPLLIKEHFMNLLIYRQLKDTFTSSNYYDSKDFNTSHCQTVTFITFI